MRSLLCQQPTSTFSIWRKIHFLGGKIYSCCLSARYSTQKLCSSEAAKIPLYFEILEPSSFLFSQSSLCSEYLVYFRTINPRLSVRIKRRKEDDFLPANLCECPLLTTISIVYQRNYDYCYYFSTYLNII